MADDWTQLKVWIAGQAEQARERRDGAISDRGEWTADACFDALTEVLHKMEELKPPLQPRIRVMHAKQSPGLWWFNADGEPRAANGQPLWLGEVIGVGRKGHLFVRWERLNGLKDAEDFPWEPVPGQDGLWLYPPRDLVEVEVEMSRFPSSIKATGEEASFRE